MDRYTGKPFLRFLEAYLLRAIGALALHEEEQLAALTPFLRQVYGGEGQWDEIVARQMDFPESFSVTLGEMWERNQEIAKQHGIELTPIQFVQMFIEQNHLIGE